MTPSDTILSKILIVGNPNVGKSSLFNQLTDTYQKVGNYPGVTTERKIGYLPSANGKIELIDLPGCYSLYPNSIDEKVVMDELLHNNCDLVLFVADASNISRSLLLYTQVADCRLPIVVVVNMLDELERHGETIDIDFLSKELGTTVFACNSKKGQGLNELTTFLTKKDFKISNHFFGNSDLFESKHEDQMLNYREWHEYVYSSKNNAIIENIKRKEIIYRYNKIETILNLTIRKTAKAFDQIKWTDKVDQWAIHPIFGYIILIGILILVFQLLFTIAAYPMEWLDSLFSYVSTILLELNNSSLILKFISEAVIPGIGGVLIFIPQIALLFLLNTILEESGYMARIVFLLDKLMRKVGLSGKSILPLLSGNACAIPAIASTKTIPTHKERLLTILCIPFMTCSARLPVYALLISITIPLSYQGIALMGLYCIGVIFSFFFAWILDKWIDTNEKSFLIMEMPPYRIPSLKNCWTNIKNAVVPFIRLAGKLIFTISIILWFLGSYTIQEFRLVHTDIEHSILANVGHKIEPTIRPLGYDWKIGVALLSSFAAREVFVSTLTTLYHIDSDNQNSIFYSIKSQINPITGQPVYSLAVGVSLLLFYAFALQCISTLAAMKKETDSWKYPFASFVIMFLLAYGSAFIAYRLLL